MNIALHRYELEGVGRLNSQSNSQKHAGCLIRITYSDGSRGYADCHPWPELGDLPLEFHLRLLRQGHLTRLTQRSLDLASHDAKYRQKGTSAFEQVKIPPSQILFTELKQLTPDFINAYSSQGYPTIKVKGAFKDLPALKEILSHICKTPLKLRVDYNCSLQKSEFNEVLHALNPFLEAIDFFEDPLPFHLGTWKDFKCHYGVTLACDKDVIKAVGFPEAADVLIVKPALYDLQRFHNISQRIVVTSYMDHPLGQVTAAWAAAKFSGQLDVCGFLTHYAYLPTPFSEQLQHRGPWLTPPQGTGFGFDDLFAKLSWENLKW